MTSKMASYFPSNLSPRMSSVRQTPTEYLSPPTLSPRMSSIRQSEPDSLSPRMLSNDEPISARKYPTVRLSPRMSSRSDEPRRSLIRMNSPIIPLSEDEDLLSLASKSVRKEFGHIAHDKIKSNDWNLIVDDILKHLKHHGVTSKLISMLHEHSWETLHHALGRALIISAVRMEVMNVASIFYLLKSLKDKYHSEVEEALHDLKDKVKYHILDGKLLEELREWL